MSCSAEFHEHCAGHVATASAETSRQDGGGGGGGEGKKEKNRRRGSREVARFPEVPRGLFRCTPEVWSNACKQQHCMGINDTGAAQVQTSPGRGLLSKQDRDDFVQNLGRLRPEMFPGIGALPESATESHVVNRGTPVAPCRLKAQRKRLTRVGSPCSPVFPNIMMFEEPHHCKAADNSLTAKAASTWDSSPWQKPVHLGRYLGGGPGVVIR